MTPDQLIAFCAFAAISSITPGPNNLMILASGVNHGLRRSLPHLAGITLGFSFMVFACGLGLHAVFTRLPWLHEVLRVVGAAYLAWLAWKLATAAPPSADAPAARQARPMSFLAAAAFQWVNPKAWVMALGALTAFLPAAHTLADVALLAAVFGVVNAPCVGVWAGFGTAMRGLLHRDGPRRVFNLACALLLLACLVPMLRG